jgi:hypothetical protein
MTSKDLYKIKVISNWDTSQGLINNWLSKMSLKPELCQTDNIRMVADDEDIDYYIIFNKPYEQCNIIPKKTIVIQLEPWCYNPNQNWGVKTWGFWSKPDPNFFMHVRNHRTYPNLLHWEIVKTMKQLETEKIEKTQSYPSLSTVTTSKYFDPGHITRIDLLKYLETKNYDVHIYGYDNKFNFKGYKGPHEIGNKNKCILPYKYYLHAENNDEYNFITEKIWDSILSECVVFYWGCHNISDYINPACYILLDPSDHEKNYQIIKAAIDNDEWTLRIDKIRQEKKRILYNFNIFPIVKNIIMSVENTPIDIWIHACSVEKGMEILNEQLIRIRNSLLYNRCRKIYIGIIGEKFTPLECFNSDKIDVKYLSDKAYESEFITVKYLINNQLDTNSNVLYIHTKGIKHGNNKKIRDWREMMEYFLIDRYEDCIKELENVDIVGCNLILQTSNNETPTHFSGNFWWANGKYLDKNKDRLGKQKYHYDCEKSMFVLDEYSDVRNFPAVEFWIASHLEAKLKSMHNSNINHYLQEYNENIYKNLC